jgi:hypothetical protein
MVVAAGLYPTGIELVIEKVVLLLVHVNAPSLAVTTSPTLTRVIEDPGLVVHPLTVPAAGVVLVCVATGLPATVADVVTVTV